MTLPWKHAATLGFLAAFTASPALSETVIMTFDEEAGDYTAFDDTIGDSTYVDVTNATLDDFGNATVYENHLEHWTNNYSELVDIAFPSNDGYVGQLAFDVTSGYQITFDSFDFGNYSNGNSPRDATFRIYNSAYNIVWEQNILSHTGNSVNLTPGVTLTGMAYFQWGTDWNVGIDNFQYTSALEDTTPAVPLPASLPLLFAGFGGMALLRRFRG